MASTKIEAVTTVDLPLKTIATGKGENILQSLSNGSMSADSLSVRELFEIPKSLQLLFVTTDRISCYDVVLKNV